MNWVVDEQKQMLFFSYVRLICYFLPSAVLILVHSLLLRYAKCKATALTKEQILISEILNIVDLSEHLYNP